MPCFCLYRQQQQKNLSKIFSVVSWAQSLNTDLLDLVKNVINQSCGVNTSVEIVPWETKLSQHRDSLMWWEGSWQWILSTSAGLWLLFLIGRKYVMRKWHINMKFTLILFSDIGKCKMTNHMWSLPLKRHSSFYIVRATAHKI